MRVIIAGGRDYRLTAADVARLDAIQGSMTEVVSGMAWGADEGGRLWALCRGLQVREFWPDWGVRGNAAGPIRNGQMAAYADGLVAFPGGRGTADMIRQAQEGGLRVVDWRTG